jgi:hypothetical protein
LKESCEDKCNVGVKWGFEEGCGREVERSVRGEIPSRVESREWGWSTMPKTLGHDDKQLEEDFKDKCDVGIKWVFKEGVEGTVEEV